MLSIRQTQDWLTFFGPSQHRLGLGPEKGQLETSDRDEPLPKRQRVRY